MQKNVVIVGGGIAGLAASIYLARAGRRVTVFEKQRFLGGRAFTHLRRGYRFNIGSHTFYRGGPGAAACRELGIPIRGGMKKPWGIAIYGGRRYRLPSGWLSLLMTSLLSLNGKRELASAFFRIGRGEPDGAGSLTLREWLDRSISDDRTRVVLEALIRTHTFSNRPEEESASAALGQLKSAMKGAVYLDEGWQKIIDSLQSAAISSGVNFVTSSRVVGVNHDGSSVSGVELGGLELDADRMDTYALAYPQPLPDRVDGARLPADAVILAVDPATAASLAGAVGDGWSSASPVTAACLDVALRSLPDPKCTFVVGIDEPVHLAVHSAFAQLTPKGGALVHVVRYQRGRTASSQEIDGSRTKRDAGSQADEQALEEALDRAQPGWRDLVVHRRFLPAMTVTNALTTPTAQRPGAVTRVRGLYIAGDWVGNQGVLSDAALSSARAAAQAILSES